MTGLRARQKADRNRRILHAASTLFYSEGYRSARIEDMAGMAEVSPGTVYNYYRTKGDLLIAISTSGASPNVLRAMELARAAGARGIGLTGRGGGRLAQLVDCCIRVPSDDVGQQEDAHLVINHLLTQGIRARLASG